MRINWGKHDRLRTVRAEFRIAQRDRRDILHLPGAPVIFRNFVASGTVDYVGIERVRRHVAVFNRADRVPIAKSDFAIIAARERANRSTFLLAAAHLVGKFIAYAHVIELQYPEWDVWLDYADLLFEADYAPQGLEMLQEALKQFPDVAELHYRLSAMLLGVGKKQEALVHLQSALTLDYDKHNELFEYAPALKDNKTVLQVIDTFKKP